MRESHSSADQDPSGGLAPFCAGKGLLRRCRCGYCRWAVNGAVSAMESMRLATRKEMRKKGKRLPPFRVVVPSVRPLTNIVVIYEDTKRWD
jgi:hypothetical protein